MTPDLYVGIPYEPEGRDWTGCDCWGLVVLCYREELGIELPHYSGYGDPLSPDAAARVEQGRQMWQAVDVPQLFDVVLFRVNGQPHHIGLVIRDGWMLHTTHGKDSCIESYERPYWRSRIDGFYRRAIKSTTPG